MTSPFNLSFSLPQPNVEEQEHSQKTADYIRAIIQKSGGNIPFSQFMELALYAPGLGYYHVGTQKFGSSGDFTTAPELSPLFGQCIANQCAQVLQHFQGGDILELGAGTGKLAAAILSQLEKLNNLPTHYYILEISPDLKARQQEYFKTHYPQFSSCLIWLDTLPTQKIQGMIIANEVIDAMPVDRFSVMPAGVQQYYIGLENNDFVWILDEASEEVKKATSAALSSLALNIPYHYTSEINLSLPAWINSLGECLSQGIILLIDYGYTRSEYYHPERSDGTIACHYKHHLHHNPLILCGIQDICAHVDFTYVAESAIHAGLNVAGFTNQANFLFSCGLAQLSENQLDLKTQRAIQKLILPGEMGEAFKVIALSKDIEEDLLGFTLQDMRCKL
jgi:SAM-dependent MidA family methyltransferase